MNLNYGTENYVVRYLQAFLQENYSNTLRITGVFDELTHQALINYLKLANTETIDTVEKNLLREFPDLSRLFISTRNNDEIVFESKTINKETSEYITNNVSAIKELVSSLGWELGDINDFVDYNMDINEDDSVDLQDKNILYNYIFGNGNLSEETRKRADLNLDGVIDRKDLQILDDYLQSGRLYINVKSSGRVNYFPNKDMLCMINMFNNKFRYNTAIRDGTGQDDFVHDNTSGDYKIAVVSVGPGETYTIAHGSSERTTLIIGSSPCYEDDLEVLKVQDVVEVTLNPGEHYVYTTSKAGIDSSTGESKMDTRNLIIQCPSTMGDISGQIQKSIPLNLGDLNFDGRIDNIDKKILADYILGTNTNLTDKQKAVADLNQDGLINDEDMLLMNQYLNKEIPSLEVIHYTYMAPSDEDVATGNNVNKLLIVPGGYNKNTAVPFSGFTTDPWTVHDKFVNYLLGMSVTPYSRSEEITYLQELLKLYYPGYETNFSVGTFDDTMRQLLLNYQNSKFTATKGDLNSDGKVDETDLLMVERYIAGEMEFSDRQITMGDIDGNGAVDETDYQLMKDFIDGKNNDLIVYEIPFSIGYLDVQTEAELLRDLQGIGVIRDE